MEEKIGWLKTLVGFLSRRLAAVIALGIVFVRYPELSPLAMILLTVAVVAFIASQTVLDWKGKKLEKLATTAKAAAPAKPAAPVAKAAVATMLLLSLAAPASAGITSMLDKLDIQLGPGLEVVDIKKFAFEPVAISTLKLYEEPRTKLELRVGGIFSEERRAAIFNVTCDITNLILREDNGETKVLAPPVGFWCGGDIISNEEGDKSVDFIWGINAAYEF